MDLAQWVLMVLLALPAAYVDRDEVDRAQRMEVIADAVSEVCDRATCENAYADDQCRPIWHRSKRELAALLVTKGWWESRFALNVHAGKCKPYECDAIKYKGTIIHRARSPWQLQRTAFSEHEWDHMTGTGLKPTRNAAWAAAKVLSRGSSRCKTPFGTLSWYGRQRCDWRGARPRYRTYTRIMSGAVLE